jgi:hypothetical protein
MREKKNKNRKRLNWVSWCGKCYPKRVVRACTHIDLITLLTSLGSRLWLKIVTENIITEAKEKYDEVHKRKRSIAFSDLTTTPRRTRPPPNE